jgi:HEAT repeat protein
MRRVGELPEAYRETWVAWVEDKPNWPELREAALADERLTAFLVDNLARVMLRAYRAGAIANANSLEVGPFERARAELRRLGGASVPTLAELMAMGDGTAAHLCAEVLTDIGRPAVSYVAMLLDRESATERARGADLLGKLPYFGDGEPDLRTALVERLDDDPDWQVRKASAEALGRRSTRDIETGQARAALSRALSDGDPEVARAAAFGLGRLGDPGAIPALLNYLERADRAADLVSYEAAQRVLRALTRSTKARTPREWRDFWRNRRVQPAGGDGANQGNR